MDIKYKCQTVTQDYICVTSNTHPVIKNNNIQFEMNIGGDSTYVYLSPKQISKLSKDLKDYLTNQLLKIEE